MLPESKMLRRALGGEFQALVRAGLRIEHLRPPYDAAFQRVSEFFQRHGQLPHEQRFLEMCSDLPGLDLARPEEAPSAATVYWEEISDFLLKHHFGTTMQGIITKYNDKSVPATQLCLDAAAALRQLYVQYGVGEAQLVKATHGVYSLWNDYNLAAQGTRPGIPISPSFPNLANGLGTWAPAAITTIVSRPGVGKTWKLLIHGLNAAMLGYRVLVASMEMTSDEITERLAALHARLNYDDLTKGKLAPDQLARYQQVLGAMSSDMAPWSNLRFMNPDSIKGIDAVEAQADAFGAHLVLADAFYDMPEGTKEKDFEKITENLRAIRRFSLSTRRHWMLTAQFNRSAINQYLSDEFAVGGSDYFNKISNNVIMLIQTKDHKNRNQVVIKLNKGRRASHQPMYLHHWNFLIPSWEPIKTQIERERGKDNKGIV